MGKIENGTAAGGMEPNTAAGDTKREHSITHTMHSGNSANEQRARLLERLKLSPVDTITARHELDILMPAARVHELRHKYGLVIDLVWIKQPTNCGKLHRVGKYVLQSEVMP